MHEAVEEGDVTARTDLGRRLLEGDGVETNVERGISILEEAARNYHPACLILGKHFILADAQYLEIERGVEFLSRAAELGCSASAFLLGLLYRSNKEPGPDLKLSHEYFRRAHDFGDVGALVEMGDTYLIGFGEAIDLPKSALFYREAQELGHHKASGRIELTNFLLGIHSEENAKINLPPFQRLNSQSFGICALPEIPWSDLTKDQAFEILEMCISSTSSDQFISSVLGASCFCVRTAKPDFFHENEIYEIALRNGSKHNFDVFSFVSRGGCKYLLCGERLPLVSICNDDVSFGDQESVIQFLTFFGEFNRPNDLFSTALSDPVLSFVKESLGDSFHDLTPPRITSNQLFEEAGSTSCDFFYLEGNSIYFCSCQVSKSGQITILSKSNPKEYNGRAIHHYVGSSRVVNADF